MQSQPVVQERVFKSAQEAEAFIREQQGKINVLESTSTTQQFASGTGASLNASGEKIVSDFNGSAPTANLTGIGGAQGSNLDSNTNVIGTIGGGNTLLIVAGIITLLGAGFALYKGWVRMAVVAGVTALVLFAVAFYPILLPWTLGIGAVALIGWLVYREHFAASAPKLKEALRAVVGGVALTPDTVIVKDSTGKDIVVPVASAVKAEIGKQADTLDRDVIRDIKREDGLA